MNTIQARNLTAGMRINVGTVENPKLGVVVKAEPNDGNSRAKTMQIAWDDHDAYIKGGQFQKSYEFKLWDPEAAFESDQAATGRGSVVCDNSRTWVAVRQTPAFAVALDIARQEQRSKIRLDQARQKLAAIESECEDGYEAGDSFTAARQTYRNDNNVLWGAARMLAAMVDNDDELGALQVLRDELDRQDAGQPA